MEGKLYSFITKKKKTTISYCACVLDEKEKKSLVKKNMQVETLEGCWTGNT